MIFRMSFSLQQQIRLICLNLLWIVWKSSHSGYTEDEKVEIAKRHLLTKQMDAHGLKRRIFRNRKSHSGTYSYLYLEAGVEFGKGDCESVPEGCVLSCITET